MKCPGLDRCGSCPILNVQSTTELFYCKIVSFTFCKFPLTCHTQLWWHHLGYPLPSDGSRHLGKSKRIKYISTEGYHLMNQMETLEPRFCIAPRLVFTFKEFLSTILPSTSFTPRQQTVRKASSSRNLITVPYDVSLFYDV